MPIIRTEVAKFVDMWNHHSIRKQSDRPNGVFGKPFFIYGYPPEGVSDYGQTPDPYLLSRLRNDTANWGKHLLTILLNY